MKHLTKSFFYFKTKEEYDSFSEKRNLIHTGYSSIMFSLGEKFEGFCIFINNDDTVLSLNRRYRKEELWQFVDKHRAFIRHLRKHYRTTVYGDEHVLGELDLLLY